MPGLGDSGGETHSQSHTKVARPAKGRSFLGTAAAVCSAQWALPRTHESPQSRSLPPVRRQVEPVTTHRCPEPQQATVGRVLGLCLQPPLPSLPAGSCPPFKAGTPPPCDPQGQPTQSWLGSQGTLLRPFSPPCGGRGDRGVPLPPPSSSRAATRGAQGPAHSDAQATPVHEWTALCCRPEELLSLTERCV